MRLITKKIASHLERNYRKMREAEAEEKDFDPLVPLKLFLPDSGFTWYVIDYDPADPDRLFCLTDGMPFDELGYTSLAELESLRSKQLRLPVERDLYWTPIRLSALRQKNAEEFP